MEQPMTWRLCSSRASSPKVDSMREIKDKRTSQGHPQENRSFYNCTSITCHHFCLILPIKCQSVRHILNRNQIQLRKQAFQRIMDVFFKLLQFPDNAHPGKQQVITQVFEPLLFLLEARTEFPTCSCFRHLEFWRVST